VGFVKSPIGFAEERPTQPREPSNRGGRGLATLPVNLELANGESFQRDWLMDECEAGAVF